jgi:hypothetical protein
VCIGDDLHADAFLTLLVARPLLHRSPLLHLRACTPTGMMIRPHAPPAQRGETWDTKYRSTWRENLSSTVR